QSCALPISATIRAMMDSSVDDETSSAKVDGYAVGGKTGTAQVGDGTYTASFIGFAPADDPELVVGLFVFGLNSFISGSRAAAPAFSVLTTFALQHQGIARTGVPDRELENECRAGDDLRDRPRARPCPTPPGRRRLRGGARPRSRRSRPDRAGRRRRDRAARRDARLALRGARGPLVRAAGSQCPRCAVRSEEHTSELQSRFDLVCRLL